METPIKTGCFIFDDGLTEADITSVSSRLCFSEPVSNLFYAVVEVSASTASVSDSSATVRLSHPFPDSDPWMVTLSSGGNIISTISVPGGAVEVRLNGLEPNQVYEAIVTRPGGLVLSTLPFLTRPFAGSAAGTCTPCIDSSAGVQINSVNVQPFIDSMSGIMIVHH